MRIRLPGPLSSTKDSYIKVTLKIIGLIVLGALGSGLWEAALKPGLVRVWYATLSISTLGLQSVRTTTYEGIASGMTAGASNRAFGLLTAFGVTFYVAIFAALVVLLRTAIAQREAVTERKIDIPTLDETYAAEVQGWDRVIRTNRRVIYVVGFIVFITAGMLFVDLARVTYETAAIVHFQQTLKIATPFLSDAERATAESKFAQIQSRADYLSVVDSLTETAKAHGQRVPKFTAW